MQCHDQAIPYLKPNWRKVIINPTLRDLQLYM